MGADPIVGQESEENQISLEGLSIAVPPRWEARISRSGEDAGGSTVRPVAHLATISLPSTRGDYGSNVVERLGPNDIFVSLVEFGSEAANSALFPEVVEFPSRIEETQFQPRQLQRVIPGQAGAQEFFTYRGRPFCLYVVLGSVALRRELASRLEELLAGISIDPQPVGS